MGIGWDVYQDVIRRHVPGNGRVPSKRTCNRFNKGVLPKTSPWFDKLTWAKAWLVRNNYKSALDAMEPEDTTSKLEWQLEKLERRLSNGCDSVDDEDGDEDEE